MPRLSSSLLLVPRPSPTRLARYAHRHRLIEVQLTSQDWEPLAPYRRSTPGACETNYTPWASQPTSAEERPLNYWRPRDPNAPLIPDIDFAELELSLRELPNLVFRRRAMKNASTPRHAQTNAPLGSRAIYGSVTQADVLQRLSDSHHLTLLPPNALLEFNDGSSKLRSTGSHRAIINLRNGTKVPLTITIEGDD
ncbi:hypothetical protein RHS01_06578 [Rhizoctonia solani]|uniref:Ribosomal protein L9 domain-containing protein n=1 Tax=Rhizoctonia solani TaxID=456999 RepID=A0A8H7ICV3_9AGAM|nr:hypothetical protein RHS01_06578 [Rhizoctonia solani]